jgi:hypothetical protein
VTTGRPLGRWELPGLLEAFAMAADGRHLAVALNSGAVYILRLPL